MLKIFINQNIHHQHIPCPHCNHSLNHHHQNHHNHFPNRSCLINQIRILHKLHLRNHLNVHTLQVIITIAPYSFINIKALKYSIYSLKYLSSYNGAEWRKSDLLAPNSPSPYILPSFILT